MVRLKAPNAQAAGGETDVFVLGMSHVSQESVDAVRSIIQAVRPEVTPMQHLVSRAVTSERMNSKIKIPIFGLPSSTAPGSPQKRLIVRH